MKILTSGDTLSEIYLEALKIRMAVFVKEQQIPYAIEVDQYEALCVHFVYYDDENQAIGTLRLLPDTDKQTMTLQRLAVLKPYRKTNIGSLLVKASESFAIKQDYHEMILHAQLTSHRFYQNLGYIAVGRPFQEADIPHIKMKRTLK
ncbi:MAG: GNAT family N-acetyltransferase [Streptococcaceae bacterium]|jgi:predicted GNAT family N-acyltransferase|nr:GNAT family N-acetyltransferase [Streptococcaceae bacterium]